MTIYNKLVIHGSEFNDYNNVEVIKTIGEANANSSFIINMDSPYGRHKSDFNVGDSVLMYADQNTLIQSGGSPVLHWKFNEGTGDYCTDSVGGIVGSFTGGALFRSGLIGSAYFGAGSYTGGPFSGFIFSGLPTFLPATSGTITCWFQPSGNIAQGHIIITGSKANDGYGAETEMHLTYNSSTNNLEWQILSGLNSSFSSLQILKPFTHNQNWNHVALVYVGSNYYAKMYLNGELVKSGLQTRDLTPQNFTNFCVGRPYNSSSRSFSGYIDDVRIYNYPISSDEVINIYNKGSGTEKENNENQKFFNGLIESKTFEGEESTENLILRGKDYSSRLMDMTVQPKVYTNTEISDIVKDILSSNLIPDITTNNVQTTDVTLARISFNHETVFDAFSQLALLCGYYFYVDVNKDLHFKPKKSSDSGIMIDNTNLLTTNFDQGRTGMFNRVWVYGDTYFDGYRESITAGSPNGGSVIILTYKPHNTIVVSSGVTLQPGGIYDYGVPASGLKYLVNYDDRKIIFLSGTNYGSNIPISGNNVTISYDRSIPIAKYGQNDTSKKMYGSKDLIIRDRNIKDPQTAMDILKAKLNDTDPLNRIDVNIKGWYNIEPGQTVAMNLNNFGIDEDQITAIEQRYNFNKESIFSENITSLTLSKKFVDITDQIKDMKDRIKNLENTYFQVGDILTRLVTDTEDLLIVGSCYNVYSRGIGSAFILNHSVNGLLGSYASHSLGDWRTGSTLIFSGGNNYSMTGSYNPENPETGGLGIMVFG